jgi:hypothetical protein
MRHTGCSRAESDPRAPRSVPNRRAALLQVVSRVERPKILFQSRTLFLLNSASLLHSDEQPVSDTPFPSTRRASRTPRQLWPLLYTSASPHLDHEHSTKKAGSRFHQGLRRGKTIQFQRSTADDAVELTASLALQILPVVESLADVSRCRSLGLDALLMNIAAGRQDSGCARQAARVGEADAQR